MRTRVARLAAAFAVLSTLLCVPGIALADDGGLINGGRAHGGVRLDGTEDSPGTGEPVSDDGGSSPVTRAVACDLTAGVSAECQPAVDACTKAGIGPPRASIVFTRQPDGSWRQTGIDCDPDPTADEALIVTAQMVRERVVELLPGVAVGIAPADGPTLVNLETVVWSPTAAVRELGPVTILGQQVGITIRFDHVNYDFGDGATAVFTAPGTAWSADLCNAAQCPNLDGHTYTATADSLTVRSTVTWTASFTVGAGPVQQIPGTIDGPTASHDLQVLQGRSVITR